VAENGRRHTITILIFHGDERRSLLARNSILGSSSASSKYWARCPQDHQARYNDNGPMHPQSPYVSAPDGAVTLLYKMGRDKWLQRFLDVNGTRSFKLIMKFEPWEDLYIQRDGCDVEIGFLDSYTAAPQPGPGVRYKIEASGEWAPVATSDAGSNWCGSDVWVRAQGEGIAKAFWYYERWD